MPPSDDILEDELRDYHHLRPIPQGLDDLSLLHSQLVDENCIFLGF